MDSVTGSGLSLMGYNFEHFSEIHSSLWCDLHDLYTSYECLSDQKPSITIR